MPSAATNWEDPRAPWTDMYKLYDHDVPLARALGLTIATDVPHATWVDLGEHVHEYPRRHEGAPPDGYRVRVETFMCPAQFFRFTIQTAEGATYVVRTGSGTLTGYWPTIKTIAEGMLEIARVDTATAEVPDA